MGWEVKTDIRVQSKHGLWKSNLKRKIFTWGLIGANFLGLKDKTLGLNTNGGVSTDYTSSNRIELSQLFHFSDLTPPGVGVGVLY